MVTFLLLSPIPIVVLINPIKKVMIRKAVQQVTAEQWTDREAIPLLLSILRPGSRGHRRKALSFLSTAPALRSWARRQLRLAIELNVEQMSGDERTRAVACTRESIGAAFSLSDIGWAEFDCRGDIADDAELLSLIGGRVEVALLERLAALAEIKNGHRAIPLFRQSVSSLKERLGKEEAERTLLRAASAHGGELLRASVSSSATSPDELLRHCGP